MAVEDQEFVKETLDQDALTKEHSFDEMARGLASDALSRRNALRLAVAAILGGTLGSFLLPKKAEARHRRHHPHPTTIPPPPPCPAGTLLHEGVCIETTKRAAVQAFTLAQTNCLNAGRRLPTLAELQTFRNRQGQDMSDTLEYTNLIYTVPGSPARIIVVSNAGEPNTIISSDEIGGVDYRCVASPD